MSHIEDRRICVNQDEVIAGELLDGISVVTVCMTGTERSKLAARYLRMHGSIKAVCLDGGLWHLDSSPNKSVLIARLNDREGPLIATFLTPRERQWFAPLLAQLRAYQYNNPKSALCSLKKLLSCAG